jgi:hypothetical protein
MQTARGLRDHSQSVCLAGTALMRNSIRKAALGVQLRGVVLAYIFYRWFRRWLSWRFAQIAAIQPGRLRSAKCTCAGSPLSKNC